MTTNVDPALLFPMPEADPTSRELGILASITMLALLASGCSGPATPRAEATHAGTGVETEAPMHYYVNNAQSIYGNVRDMVNKGEYHKIEPQLNELLSEPAATWVGEWLGGIPAMQTAVGDIATKAEAAKEMPVFVAYNIPNRDLGEYSAGGAKDAEHYKAYTAAISAGIGGRHAVIILEPDALPGVPDMSKDGGDARIDMLRTALATYAANNPNARVYLDGGHSKWLEPAELVALLKRVDGGKGLVKGISLNVSNYRPTDELTTYFNAVNTQYGGTLKGFLDTGLNGADTPPAPDAWANPREARHAPVKDTLFDPNAPIEELTVRIFGESSGDSKFGDPDAGRFDPDLLATELGLPSGRYKPAA